ncbi:alpha/beta hydrolase [Rhizobium sp. RAF56]|uniref:alpha/beta hydrolase n=1 Tax=Rhizobium sp. RAF56 TaxID=3233062 RepID=UPI003F94AD69
MPSNALKVTRLVFSGLSALSPTLAGKAAFHLFCLTPSRRPKGQKARAVHAEGEARLKGAERIALSFDGGQAFAYRWNGGAMGPRRRYLVLHGWGSSIAYMTDLVLSLAETGAEVVALDFPGHGRAPGRFLNMRLAVAAIAAAQSRFGRFDATIGHSFGGASTMVSVAGLLPEVTAVAADRMVVIGSPSEMLYLFTSFGKMIGLRAPAQAALEAEVGRVTGRRLEEFDAGAAAGALGKPVLVVHAEDDKEVSADHARAYAAAGDHVRMFWANGFGHRRIVSAEPVLSAIREFLDERTPAEQMKERPQIAEAPIETEARRAS